MELDFYPDNLLTVSDKFGNGMKLRADTNNLLQLGDVTLRK